MKRIAWLNLVILLCLVLASIRPVGAVGQPPAAPEPRVPHEVPPLGQPGLAYHVVASFGQNSQPYQDSPAYLNSPHGLTTDGNTIWITERIGKRALNFAANGVALHQIGKPMNGLRWVLAEADRLCDVAVASDHNIWLDYRGGVYKVDMAGQYLAGRSGGPATSYNCHSLAVDGADRLYVADSESHIITVYGPTGAYLKTVGGAGDEPINFSNPEQISISGSILYVADANNNRVVMIDIADIGHFTVAATLDEYDAGGNLDNFNYPTGVAVDASNRLFVVDSRNHRVQVFTRSTLAYLTTLGSGPGSGDSQWNSPYDVAVDSGGLIYVSDEANHRVQQFSSSLARQRTLGVTQVPYLTDGHYLNKPYAVQGDSEGSLYVTENSVHRVVKLSAAGNPLFILGQVGIAGDDNGHFSNPKGLAVDALNHLYVADSGNHRIVVFDKNGGRLSSFGSYGSGNDQFRDPVDIAIDPGNGDIAVADRGNNRVQVFSSTWAYKTTLGVTGAPGTDSDHFQDPSFVAIGPSHAIYVTDINTVQRIQKCVLGTPNACTNLTGKAGDGIDDYQEFITIISGLAVDVSERVYIPTFGPQGVVVYDSNGSFLGGVDGGMLPTDVTFDPSGNVFVSSSYEHVLYKSAPAVPGWNSKSVQCFGDMDMCRSPLLAAYGSHLYAGLANPGGAQVWRMTTAGAWSRVVANGIDDPLNESISSITVYDNKLFLGTVNVKTAGGVLTGARIYSYDGSTWTRAAEGGLGTPTNFSFTSLASFGGYLYAGTRRADSTVEPATPLGAQIWRSASGTSGWEKVLDLNGTQSYAIHDLAVFNGYLYAAVANDQTGSEVWRSDGSGWIKVVDQGFYPTVRNGFTSLASHSGYLYLGGIGPGSGARIWRCQACTSQADFELVVDNGFNGLDLNGDVAFDNIILVTMLSYEGTLYAFTYNQITGNEPWRSRDGLYWERLDAAPGQFFQLGPSAAVLDDQLYLGLVANRIWQLQPRLDVIKTGSGSGTVTSAPAGITCGTACSIFVSPPAALTLTAAAADGSTFSGWSGEGCGGTGTCVVTVDRLRAVQANFTITPSAYTLSVSSSGTGTGVITSTPAGINCGANCQFSFTSGTAVDLSAAATSGTFMGWSGDCSGSGSCRVTLSAARSVSALFTQHPPVASPFSRHTAVNNPLPFTQADFSENFSDTDGDALYSVRITALPQHGVLWNGDSLVTLNQEIAAAKLAALQYWPSGNYSGADSFGWNGSDGVAYAVSEAAVALSVQNDGDSDAVGDLVEASVPALLSGGLPGDGNGDGLLDSSQSNVASVLAGAASTVDVKSRSLAPAAAQYFTLDAPAGLGLYFVVPLPYPASNPAPPKGVYSFPAGFAQFDLANLAVGSSPVLELFLTGPQLPDRVYGFGPTPGNALPHWYEFMYDGSTGAVIEKLPSGKIKITLHFQDGARGDSDLAVNGLVSAQVGPALLARYTFLPAVRK